MATTLTNVRIDTQVKNEASDILSGLGMNISEAVNIFLRQVILHGGTSIPGCLSKLFKRAFRSGVRSKENCS